MALQATPGTDPTLVPRPSGGGGFRGLGEAFSPDLATGTGNFSIPLWTPRGPNHFAPELALTYSTARGNGPFGLGWALDTLALRRESDRGVPSYLDAEDRFVLAGETLVETEPGVFRHQREDRFVRAERDGDGWIVRHRTGLVSRLGSTADARETVTLGGVDAIYAWHLDESRDTNGNSIRYGYRRDGGRLYLASVAYGAARIDLDYESRLDVQRDGRRGVETVTALRCREITCTLPTVQAEPVRRYHLGYDERVGLSLLNAVEMSGDRGDGVLPAPVVRLSYTAFEPERRRFRALETVGGGSPPPTVQQRDVELTDIVGDGLPDVVQLAGSGSRWWQNLGDGRFSGPRTLPSLPEPVRLDDPRVALADLTGSATADVLNLGTRPFGLYAHQPGVGWSSRHAYRRELPFDLTDPTVRLVDLDGDGRVDVLRAGDRVFTLYFNRFGRAEGEWDGPFNVPRVRDRTLFPDLDFRDDRVRFADMTGDGLADVVYLRGALIEFWPYLGRGRWAPRRAVALPDAPARLEPERFFVHDIDGDGIADFVYVDRDRVYLWRHRGGGVVEPRRTVAFTPSASGAAVRMVDMEGTGTAGVLWTFPLTRVHQSTYRFLDFTGGIKPYLLNGIDYGTGKQTRISYRSSIVDARTDAAAGRPWETYLPFPVQVVSDIVETDTLAGTERVRRLRYRNGGWDPVRRRFTGFGEVDSLEIGDASIEGARTITQFEQGVGLNPDEAAVLTGRPRRVEIRAVPAAGGEEPVLRIEDSAYEVAVVGVALDGQPIRHARLVVSRERDFAGGPDEQVRETHLEYDGFGNITTKEEEVRRGAEASATTTVMRYAVREDIWMLDRPVEIRRDGGGLVLALQRFYYDGPAFQGLPAGSVERGNLTRVEELVLTPAMVTEAYGAAPPDFAALGYRLMPLPGGADGWGVDAVRRRFDARGNVLATRDPLDSEAQLVWDADGIYPVESVNPLGQRTQFRYDPIAKQPARQDDPNGAVFEYGFDALGRLIRQIGPGDSAALPSVVLEYQDDALPLGVIARTRVTSGGAATVAKAEYYDGEGRSLQERVQAEADTVTVLPAAVLNARGEVAQRPLPFGSAGLDYVADEPGSPGATRLTYDALARVLSTEAVDGTVTRFVYRLGERDMILPDDVGGVHPRTEQRDLRGNPTSVIERAAGVERTTRYNYDDNDRLVEIVDADGRSIARYVRDLENRVLRIDHVDAGSHVAVHDAVGQRVRRVGADRRTVDIAYDEVGRVLAVGIDGAEVERFHYDAGPGSNLVSRLARVEDALGVTEFAYDARGRTTVRTVTAAEGVFRFEFDYDQLDRPVEARYPNGERLMYGYDGTRLATVAGVIDAVGYGEQGQMTEIRFANGAVQRFDHDPVTLRVAGLALSVPGTAAPVLSRAYGYTASGLPAAVTDETGAVQSFVYDDVGQLTRTFGVAGGVALDRSYDWDTVGNPRQSPTLGPGDLVYQVGSNRLIGRRDGGVDQVLISYDGAGRMVDTPMGRFTWEARGRLVQADTPDGTRLEFGYGYDGRRVRTRQTMPDGAVRVRTALEGDYELVDGVARLWVGVNGQAVAVLETGGRRRFLHADYRGDIVAVTDETGAVVSRRSYLPFGETHTQVGETPDLGFIGLEAEAVLGLMQFGSRWYHPGLGRFISPDLYLLFDPEQVLATPILLNPYAYAANNPMVLHDRSGRRPDWWHWLVGALVIAALVAATIVVGIFTGGAGFAFGVLLFASIGSVMGSAAGVATAAIAGGDLSKGFMFGAIVGGASGALSYAAFAGVGAALGTSGFWAQGAAGAAMGAFQTAGTGAIWGYAGGLGSVEDVLINAAIGFGIGAAAGFLSAGPLYTWLKTVPGIEKGVGMVISATGISSSFAQPLVAGMLIGSVTYPAYQSMAQSRGNIAPRGTTGSTASPLRSSTGQQALTAQSATSNLSPRAGLSLGATASQVQAAHYATVSSMEVDVSITVQDRRMDRVLTEALGS
jgi:RHS repeat-associated protein